MPNPTPSFTRVMLLLPNPLAEFVDREAAKAPRLPRPSNRQDVIRDLIYAKMQESPDPSKPTSQKRRRVSARK